jgi:hypothetical protein
VTRFLGADYRTLLPEFPPSSKLQKSLNHFRKILFFHYVERPVNASRNALPICRLPTGTLHYDLQQVGETRALQRGVHSIVGKTGAL